MSQIIASDAPLLSPIADSAPWDAPYAPTYDAFAHYYIPASPSSSASTSPATTSRMLKMRMSPDSASESEQQLCLPTHQVFDFPEQVAPAPTSAPQQQERLSISINPSAVAASMAAKRTASPAPTVPKKPRAAGERISSKDFVPPDVSGLSKREARLVKNRAAAFLSRQRKREEFEQMEIRVAELEQENARLLALTQTGSSGASKDSELASEVERLKAQLAAAKERERQLSAELISKSQQAAIASNPSNIKVEEASDPQIPLSTASRSSAPSATKSGASLGLMQVLLCALPTLLSMPMNSAVPKSFALPDAPLPAAPAAFDFNSYLPSDYDWSRATGNSPMDLDDLDMSSTLSATTSQKLEFSTAGAPLDADNGLNSLDISFDALPADNGKIRVRIHPSSSASSRATSPGLSSGSESKGDIASWSPESDPTVEPSFSPQSFTSSSSLSTLSSSSLSSSSSYLSPPSPKGDPFLGVGASSDYTMPYSHDMSDMFGQMDDSLSGGSDFGQDVGYGSETSVGDSGAKRRVRIALKSLPHAGGEGGEWEVQIC
ncbi:putative bZIP transcription factor [Lyophyllum shimeji]|uniref:BZIP transcription factor n=1 Tax=Lyophyllum shimeji TaxID=47721 RepID=A0A9P3PLP4_LYOSH|nr:putative bZIP transcription factor [Lyophyllum shimeji]